MANKQRNADNNEDDTGLELAGLFLRVTMFSMGALMLVGAVAIARVQGCPVEEGCTGGRVALLVLAAVIGAWGLILAVAAFMPSRSRLFRLAERIFPNPAAADELGCLFFIALLPIYAVARLIQRVLRR